VIDYALAKGLAHEAFGHAAEADGFRSSVLAREGRLMVGRIVGADHVSIIDEAIAGDHAWQPYSANAVPRGRVTIVDHGHLREGLTDLFSAREVDASLTGAGRAESFRDAPLPRMSNIRIEADGARSAPGEFEDYTPERVRDLLAADGVFRRHPEIAYLSGYSGGQVNTVIGEFVFQCRAIWRLSRNGVELFRPAAFAGSMFGALGSIREAYGPLRLDALGWCGKWGQSVPSSGGSHWFLVLDPTEDVRLGGSG
jgi:TldD protein